MSTQEEIGRIIAGAVDPANDIFMAVGAHIEDEVTDRIMDALGGTWGDEHAHVFESSPRDLTSSTTIPCQDPCVYAGGRHVRRRSWRSDPL